MKKRWFDNPYVKWAAAALSVVFGGLVLYYLFFHMDSVQDGISVLGDVLAPILVGIAVAYLLTPVLNFIEKRILIPILDLFKIKDSRRRKKAVRFLGILVTGFLFFALLYFLSAIFLSQIIPSLISLIQNYDVYLENVTNWIDDILTNNPALGDTVTNLIDRYSDILEEWFNNTAMPWLQNILRSVSLSLFNLLKALWYFILGFIISIYVLASKERFAGQAKKTAYAFFSLDTANVLINNFRFAHKTFVGFIIGKVIDSIIMGVLCMIGTTILGTPYAVLVSLIIGVTNIIPFFGPFIGAIPCTILIFIVDLAHPLNCLYFVIFILILQQIDGNIIGPRILGNSTGIMGFWVIFAITFFGAVFGILGMIIGVPVFAIFYAIVKSVVNLKLRRKGMPEDTDKYVSVRFVDEDGFHEDEKDPRCVGSAFYSSADEIDRAREDRKGQEIEPDRKENPEEKPDEPDDPDLRNTENRKEQQENKETQETGKDSQKTEKKG